MRTTFGSRRGIAKRKGFTLVELLITLVTLVIVVGAAMVAYIYGLKMFQFTTPKLVASDDARRAISLLTDEIRSARAIKIGDGDVFTFTEVSPFSAQVGSAIQIYPGTGTNQFIRYFVEASDNTLRRVTNGSTDTRVVANSVSNQLVFTAEDASGRVVSNNFNNRVIGMTLQFYQIQYPVTAVGPGNYYDFYQFRTKVTRRTLL